jgi:hypothetical protein
MKVKHVRFNSRNNKVKKIPGRRPFGSLRRGGSWIGDTLKKVKQAIFFPSDSYSKSSQATLKREGDKQVYLIEIRRAPIYSQIDKALDIISFGTFSKAKRALAYDNMYHLSMICHMTDGTQVKVEKNEKINITTNISKLPDTEAVLVNVEPPLTLNTMLYNTEKQVGKRRFYQYSAFEYNCQRFILDILQSNNLATKESEKFILQNAIELASRLPDYAIAISQFITDTAGKLRELTGGRITRRDVIEVIYDDQKKKKKIKRKTIRFNEIPRVILEDGDFTDNFDDLLDAYCNENRGETKEEEIPEDYEEKVQELAQEKKARTKRKKEQRKREDEEVRARIFQDGVNSVEKKVKELEQELKDDIQNASDEITQYQVELKDASEEKYRLERLLNENERKFNLSKGEVKALEVQVDDYKNTIDELKVVIQELKDEVKALKRQLISSQSVSEAKQGLEDIERMAEELGIELDEPEQELEPVLGVPLGRFTPNEVYDRYGFDDIKTVQDFRSSLKELGITPYAREYTSKSGDKEWRFIFRDKSGKDITNSITGVKSLTIKKKPEDTSAYTHENIKRALKWVSQMISVGDFDVGAPLGVVVPPSPIEVVPSSPEIIFEMDEPEQDVVAEEPPLPVLPGSSSKEVALKLLKKRKGKKRPISEAALKKRMASLRKAQLEETEAKMTDEEKAAELEALEKGRRERRKKVTLDILKSKAQTRKKKYKRGIKEAKEVMELPSRKRRAFGTHTTLRPTVERKEVERKEVSRRSSPGGTTGEGVFPQNADEYKAFLNRLGLNPKFEDNGRGNFTIYLYYSKDNENAKQNDRANYINNNPLIATFATTKNDVEAYKEQFEKITERASFDTGRPGKIYTK